MRRSTRSVYRVTGIVRYSKHQLRVPPIRVTVVFGSPADVADPASVVEDRRRTESG